MDFCQVDESMFGKNSEPYFFYIHNQMFEKLACDTTLLSNISFKIGFPYLFRHSRIDNGKVVKMCCDHIFFFTDLRLASEKDQQLLDQNILQTFQALQHRKYCELCEDGKTFAAAIAVIKD